MPSSGGQTCALRSEEHTSELQLHDNLVCRLLLEKTNSDNRSDIFPADRPAVSLTTRTPASAPVHAHAAHRRHLVARSIRCGTVYRSFFLKRPPPSTSPQPPPTALFRT